MGNRNLLVFVVLGIPGIYNIFKFIYFYKLTFKKYKILAMGKTTYFLQKLNYWILTISIYYFNVF